MWAVYDLARWAVREVFRIAPVILLLIAGCGPSDADLAQQIAADRSTLESMERELDALRDEHGPKVHDAMNAVMDYNQGDAAGRARWENEVEDAAKKSWNQFRADNDAIYIAIERQKERIADAEERRN